MNTHTHTLLMRDIANNLFGIKHFLQRNENKTKEMNNESILE